MAHTERARSLQLLVKQISKGLQVKELEGDVGLAMVDLAMKLIIWARRGFQGLSYFIAICFNQILMTAGRRPLGEAMAILLIMVCCVGSTITGACGELVKEANTQSCIFAAPHVWEILRDHALQALAVVTTLVAMAITGVLIAQGMFKNQPTVPAIPIPIPAPVPAVPAIPAAVQALPVMPAVQGDDIDDVLARAPIATRLNSPLAWL